MRRRVEKNIIVQLVPIPFRFYQQNKLTYSVTLRTTTNHLRHCLMTIVVELRNIQDGLRVFCVVLSISSVDTVSGQIVIGDIKVGNGGGRKSTGKLEVDSIDKRRGREQKSKQVASKINKMCKG